MFIHLAHMSDLVPLGCPVREHADIRSRNVGSHYGYVTVERSSPGLFWLARHLKWLQTIDHLHGIVHVLQPPEAWAA